MLPNLFLVGAKKSATTTVFQMLERATDIAMCRSKEPSHFCTDLFDHPEFSRTQGPIRKFTGQSWAIAREDYLARFPTNNSRWHGEASTNYLYSKVAAKNIREFNPDARIVILLRDPIKRTCSEYAMLVAHGRPVEQFSKAIRDDFELALRGLIHPIETFVTASLYAGQVERYLQYFPRDQVLIHVIDKPGDGFSQTAAKLSAFLDTDVRDLPVGANLNSARAIRFQSLNRFLYRHDLAGLIARTIPRPIRRSLHPIYYGEYVPREISGDDLAFLRGIYRHDILRLSELIGEDLSFWC